MSPYLSDKIKVISLIAITMVIYIHTYYTEGENYPIFMSLQRILGMPGLPGIANPLFYFTSGYLFFLSANTIKDCFPKIKKRIKTLLVPYLLANTLALIMYTVIDVISHTSPKLYNVINFHITDWFSKDLSDLLYHIYWQPVAFQLWFVREMLIFVFLSPVIFVILKKVSSHRILSFIALILLLAAYYITNMPVLWMAIGGMISLSGIIDITRSGMTRTKTSLMYICGTIFLVFVIVNGLGIYKIKFGYALFGVIALWILYDKIVKGRILCKNNKLAQACSYSFFIYLIHEPTLLIFKKIPLLLFGKNEIALTVSFIIIPIIFVIVTIYIGKYLRKYIPNAFSIYTEGR